MVTKFKTYESNFNRWPSDYITAVPSGEVIYASEEDINKLKSINWVIKNKRGIICSDQLVKDITSYINDSYTERKLRIIDYLIDWGLLKDQFVIYDDFSVDAMGPINMTGRGYVKIPVKFNRCTSDFICSHNKLDTLKNSPHTIHGNFDCSDNNLNDLIGGPKLVSGVYNCSNNMLITLKGVPLKLRYFNCSDNLLHDLEHAPSVIGHFIKNNNFFKDD